MLGRRARVVWGRVGVSEWCVTQCGSSVVSHPRGIPGGVSGLCSLASRHGGHGGVRDSSPRRRTGRCGLRSLRLPPRPSRYGALSSGEGVHPHRRCVRCSPRRPVRTDATTPAPDRPTPAASFVLDLNNDNRRTDAALRALYSVASTSRSLKQLIRMLCEPLVPLNMCGIEPYAKPQICSLPPLNGGRRRIVRTSGRLAPTKCKRIRNTEGNQLSGHPSSAEHHAGSRFERRDSYRQTGTSAAVRDKGGSGMAYN